MGYLTVHIKAHQESESNGFEPKHFKWLMDKKNKAKAVPYPRTTDGRPNSNTFWSSTSLRALHHGYTPGCGTGAGQEREEGEEDAETQCLYLRRGHGRKQAQVLAFFLRRESPVFLQRQMGGRGYTVFNPA